MKLLNKLLITAMVSLIPLSIVGCFDKTSISPEDFKTKSENKGYTIHDITENYQEYNSVLTAVTKDESYQIEFYDLPSVDDAKSFFSSNKDKFEKSSNTSSIKTEVNLPNNSKYTRVTGDTLMFVGRIDNTTLYCEAPEKYKEEIGKLIEELGY